MYNHTPVSQQGDEHADIILRHEPSVSFFFIIFFLNAVNVSTHVKWLLLLSYHVCVNIDGCI